MEIDYNPMNDILFKFIFGAEERKNITINFLNAVMNKNIREIEFHNVELNPQHETEKSVGKMNKIEKWPAFLSKKLNREEMEELAMTEPAIQDALSAANVFFADDKKYWEYLNRQAAILDYNSGIEGARKKGREEGREEGIISVAKNMINSGMSFDDIKKFTNLSVEKIQELAK